jgi:3',5'-cyclic AMP phosphodiesterase CpdA
MRRAERRRSRRQGGADEVPSKVRRILRRTLLGATAVVVALAAVFGLTYRDQIVRYVTHLKGSPTHTVAWTPPAPGEDPLLRIAVAGDVGESGPRLDATADAIARIGALEPFDALLLLGDNAYPAGDPQALHGTVFRPFAGVLDQGAELLAVLGNHDVMQGHADAQVSALAMPGRWWSRSFGDVLVIGLDSTIPNDPDQLAFLERTLADSTAVWKIVALHHPPYSAGYQGSNETVRAAFSPLFERYGVQLVLSGHDHDYQRSDPIGGVTYVVSGGAAVTRRTGEASYTAVSFSWHHFVELTVLEDRLVLRAVNQDLRVADEVVIPVDPVPEPTPLPAWLSPDAYPGRGRMATVP